MARTLSKDVLVTPPTGQEITVGGWVRTVRNSKGGFSFLTLNDGSTIAQLQVVADGKLANYAAELVKLTAGCAVLATGTLVASQGKGQTVELQATAVQVLGWADPEQYPIQPKKHTFEFLRTQAHLRARTNTFAAVTRIRNVVSMAIHDFFQQRGFIYVHTPIITASDCEGAGQMFRVTTLDPTKTPQVEKNTVGQADRGTGAEDDFFGRPTYLTVSGQLEGETYACAMGNIYTFGPTFRAENSNTPRHLAEFWMVEPEMAFCDLEGDAETAEAFLKHIFRSALERCTKDLEFLSEHVDATVLPTLTAIVASDFERVTYTEAVALLEKSGRTWQFPVGWGTDLQTEHERYLTEEVFRKPVVVTHYPAAIKSFYMRLDDGTAPGRATVAAMDVLVPKIGELIGGSQREERLDVLLGRMAELKLRPEDYWWYLDLRRYGSVPHAGFGLGLERTLQFITGMANIRDVIPYPRFPRSAEF
jgi:asparaginyl-tRNA synthetase